MLTLEQCKKLQGWGFPQIGCWWNYYDRDGKIEAVDRIMVSDYFGGKEKFICARPGLEKLLEFTDKVVKQKYQKGTTLLIHSEEEGVTIGWTAAIDNIALPEWTLEATDPDPKQAIYKLLEQVIEPNNKVKETENGESNS